MTIYARPCDHCGGEVRSHEGLFPRSGHEGLFPRSETGEIKYRKTPAWKCANCECAWTVAGFVLYRKGLHCPVHGIDATAEAVRA
jgi:hypothetical protein